MSFRHYNIPLLAVLLTLLAVATPLSAAKQDIAWRPGSSFLLLPVEGVIHGGTVETLREAIERTDKESHQGLIVQLDTPGGLLEATREIVKLFLNSEVPVIVFVGPGGARAGSAGTFLTLAGHVAVMAPGTNIGAAHPITITGKDPEKEGGKHLAQKIENDTLAFIETIAKQRGRNIEWAKKAVKESSSITEEKALELKVIDFIARTDKDVVSKLDGRKVKLNGKEITFDTEGASVESIVLPLTVRLLNFLASPTVMFLLIIVFVLGLYVEFSNPGLIFPAVASGVSLIVLLFASRALPISYLGILLMLTGVAMLILEVYVTSFGFLTVAGLVCFFLGGMVLFDPAKTDVRLPLSYLISATVGVGVIAAAIGYMMVKTFSLPEAAGKESLVGKHAEVETVADEHKLRVFIAGEYWSAECDNASDLKKGDSVEVVSVDGLKLTVKRSA